MNRSAPVILYAVTSAFFLLWCLPLIGHPSFGPSSSWAQDGWKVEYESVCSKTDIAMTLSAAELKGLIARCDQLKPRIEAEEESTRKVYLQRLRMCRELYKYVLDNKD